LAERNEKPKNVNFYLFSLIISMNMLLLKVHVLHLPVPSSFTSW